MKSFQWKGQPWNLEDVQETEDEDFIRNLDVAVRLRNLRFSSISKWLLNHAASPDIYKEKVSTEIGRRQAEYLLKRSFNQFRKKMKEADSSRKNQHHIERNGTKIWSQFYLAQFHYPEWDEKTVEHGNFLMAKDDAKRVEALLETERRHILMNKFASQMKELRGKANFPSPSKQTLNKLSVKNTQKKEFNQSLPNMDKNIETAKKELNELNKLCSDFTREKKKARDLKNYWDTKKNELVKKLDVEHKYKSSVRNNKNAAEKLQFEKNHLISLKEDKRILKEENMDFHVRMADYEDGTINGFQEGSKIYRSDVCEVISEIYNYGVDYVNIQSIFETIFATINHDFINFPHLESLQKQRKRAEEEDPDHFGKTLKKIKSKKLQNADRDYIPNNKC